MKLSFRPARLWPVAVFPIVLAGSLCWAQTPAAVPPMSPAAGEVLKLAQAGIDPSLMKSYIANVAGPFSLDADGIIYLKNAGVPSDVINLMLARDGAATPAPMPAPAPAAAPVTAPAPEPLAASAPEPAPGADLPVDQLSEELAPYGAWVEVDGYGRCWRPTVAMYDATWQPYCDNGQWVYTDAGWYWSSGYEWGAAFHYGRWFHHPQWGWCWWPDTVWAPSWVLWRSDDDNCGWAPLPPFALYRPGFGFYYNGVSVGADYDFGLSVNFFTFVPAGHFCDREPGHFRLDDRRREEVFHHAGIVGGYGAHGNRVANRGIPVERVSAAAHRTITPVAVERVAGAGRPAGQNNNGFNGGGRTVTPAPRTEPVTQYRAAPAAGQPGQNLRVAPVPSRNVPNSPSQPLQGYPSQPREQPQPPREEPRTYVAPAAPREPSTPAPSSGHGQNLGNTKNNQGH